MQKEGKEVAALDGDCAPGSVNVTVVTDADYRSLFLPCDALDDSAGAASSTGPLLAGGDAPSRAAGR